MNIQAARIMEGAARLLVQSHMNKQAEAAEAAEIANLTHEEAMAMIASNPGRVTIHRRQKTGSIPCWGKCGRTISANKALCRTCQEEHDRTTAAADSGRSEKTPVAT